MLYASEPEGFNPKFEVVGCFVESNGEILLLHRQDHKPEGNTWGIPSGKIDEGETPQSTVIRELGEETGFKLPESEVLYLTKLYVRFPLYDFIYHVFRTKLAERESVKLNPSEHKDFKWVVPEKAEQLNLIGGLKEGITIFYGNQNF